jgi:hypothetical protein
MIDAPNPAQTEGIGGKITEEVSNLVVSGHHFKIMDYP